MGRPSNAKQRLIAAARKVIFTHSYEGVSVDDLCLAAEVNKSSFYHYFPSKQELLLTAIDSQWEWFEQTILKPTFLVQSPPHQRIQHFFDLTMERQQEQKQLDGHMCGCPAGNLTLEMGTQDEAIRARIALFFRTGCVILSICCLMRKNKEWYLPRWISL